MTITNAETKRARSTATSKAMTRVAAFRKCPRCQRKAALSARVRWEGVGSARRCNYCGHECGSMYGKPFGYDVTREPGARA